MIVFWLICAVLLGLAQVSLLWPLWGPARALVVTGATEANLAVYRRQLAELESDRHHRTISDQQFGHERDELERRLALDLTNDPGAARATRHAGSTMLIYCLGIGVTLATLLLYLALGTPPPPPG